MSLFIGLDIGTQSVKLIAYDPERRAQSPPLPARRWT